MFNFLFLVGLTPWTRGFPYGHWGYPKTPKNPSVTRGDAESWVFGGFFGVFDPPLKIGVFWGFWGFLGGFWGVFLRKHAENGVFYPPGHPMALTGPLPGCFGGVFTGVIKDFGGFLGVFGGFGGKCVY